MEKDYYFSHIGKKASPALIFVGELNLEPRPFQNLRIGDKISRIGGAPKTGPGSGMAALNRCQMFSPYVTYSGISKIEEFGEYDLIFFEIRPEDKPEHITDPMYTAYIVLRHEEAPFLELKLWDHANNTSWIARPEFQKIL